MSAGRDGDDTVITLSVVPDETPVSEGDAPPGAAPSLPEPISFSRMSSWLSCGEKFRLSYIEAVPREPQGALIGGSAIHSTIEEGEREGVRDIRPLVEIFSRLFIEELQLVGGPEKVRWSGRTSKAYPDREDHRWWADNAPLMLQNYLDVRAEDDSEGVQIKQDGIEVKVLTQLPSGTPLLGYLDVFIVDADGEAIVRDWKSGKVGGINGLQLATYAWAWNQITGTLPVRGEYVYLRTADPAKRRQTVNLSPLIPLVPRLFQMFEDGIKAGVFPINPSAFCSSCSVRVHCPYGSTLEG